MPQAGRLHRGVLCLLAAAAGAPTSAQPANAPMLAVPLDPIAAILEALRLGRMALTPPPPDAAGSGCTPQTVLRGGEPWNCAYNP